MMKEKMFVTATSSPHALANVVSLSMPANEPLTARETVTIHAAKPFSLYLNRRPPGVGGPKTVGPGSAIYSRAWKVNHAAYPLVASKVGRGVLFKKK